MSLDRPVFRTAALASLVVAVLATSGCGWFRKENALYAAGPENRPLEVPPDLDRPGTGGAMVLPDAAPVARADAAPAAASGFTLAGERDAVFARVGEVLAATADLTVTGSAQLLGTYDVNYGGSSFLVRVSRVETGVQVTAVDPRGQPAQGEAPARLLQALRSALGG